MAKQLQLGFRTEEGGSMTLNIDFPIEPVEVEDVIGAMDAIIAEGVFMTSSGQPVEKRSARLVERHVDEIDIS